MKEIEFATMLISQHDINNLQRALFEEVDRRVESGHKHTGAESTSVNVKFMKHPTPGYNPMVFFQFTKKGYE